MSDEQVSTVAERRKFLKGAAVAAGAAALGFPNVLKAQGPINMRWQSTWAGRRTSSTSTPSTSPRGSTT